MMEDFSYQPFLLDPAHHLPPSPLQVEEASNGASCFLYYHALNSVPETSTTESKTHESSSSLDISRVSAEKRGNRGGSCLTSVQPKNSMEAKSRKQRKPSGGGGGGDVKQAERKKLRADEKEKDACEEPPVGYIHVRARRGQATDSHSLSERARREKIGERMKLLQTLVPGCDKVIGKALMLDEIINYVQSLQNQVEFLSMKLAAMNPVLYNFGVDFDGHLNQLEKLGSINQASHFHLNALEDTPRNYPIMGTPSPFLLHTQGPITFSQNTASLMQMGDQRPGFLN